MTLAGLPSREAIRRHQSAALARLLESVAAGNPFYAPVLRKAGLAGPVDDLDRFVRSMPLTRKQDLIDDQRRHPPYGTNLTCPVECYTRFNQTSATSGTPLRWLDTPESWQGLLDNWKQVLRAADVGPVDRLYFAFSFGPFLGFWTAYEAAAQLGCLCIPGGGTSSLGRLEAMRDNRATVLLCTPTYAMRLGQMAAEQQFDTAALDVRTILVAGEPGGSVPGVRAQIERLWPGARVFDHHGMTEVGPVSHQCPEKPGTLMIIETAYLAEILSPETFQPVPRGEMGELVLTTLNRHASPLLRYRTGDLVREDTEVAERFNRHEMALAGGILGRSDDMLLVRGVNVYPSAVEEVIRSFPEVAEFQVVVSDRRAMPEMHLRIEPLPDCLHVETLLKAVAARIRSAFNLRVTVSACEPEGLPRYEMKSRRWVREAGG